RSRVTLSLAQGRAGLRRSRGLQLRTARVLAAPAQRADAPPAQGASAAAAGTQPRGTATAAEGTQARGAAAAADGTQPRDAVAGARASGTAPQPRPAAADSASAGGTRDASVRQPRQQRVFIKISPAHEEPQRLTQLQSLLQRHPGPLPVALFYERTQRALALSDQYRVKPSKALLQAIEAIMGTGTARVK
ncbi:hypothetical protein SD70_30405, partial [Gordoniibacillus kamchatkensis]